MSPKIESSRPLQVSRPALRSPVSPAAAKATPAPSATPRPISDGFDRAAPSATAQASRGARLEGAGTPLARELGTSVPNSTSVDQEPYDLNVGGANQLADRMEGPGPIDTYRTGGGTAPPLDDILTPALKNRISELVAAADLLSVKNPGDLHKVANEISRQVERPEGVSPKDMDDYITQKLLERMASEGIDLGTSLGGKTSP